MPNKQQVIDMILELLQGGRSPHRNGVIQTICSEFWANGQEVSFETVEQVWDELFAEGTIAYDTSTGSFYRPSPEERAAKAASIEVIKESLPFQPMMGW